MTTPIVEITGLGRRAKAAIDRYKTDYQKLFDRRGFPRFPRAEFDARVADLRGERNEVLREIEARTNEIFREAEAEVEHASQFVPRTVLSPIEQSGIPSSRPVVEADIAGLSETELAERLEGVLREGSRLDKFLYTQESRKRRREIVERKVSAAREASGGLPVGMSQETMSTALDDALARLEGVLLGPETQRRTERWSEIAREADKVAQMAFLGARDAESYQGVVAQRHSYREFAERQQREPRVQPASSGGGSIADVAR